jgi:hypothetical protein
VGPDEVAELFRMESGQREDEGKIKKEESAFAS